MTKQLSELRFGCYVLSFSVSLLLAKDAQAFNCQLLAGTSDKAVMDSFPIPTFRTANNFVQREASDFVIVKDAWTGRGTEAWDDPRYEYFKHWLSAYVIANSFVFETTGISVDSAGNPITLLIDRAFHTPNDYYSIAKGEAASGWHDQFLSLPGQYTADGLLAAFQPGGTGVSPAAAFFWPLAFFPERRDNTVTTHCGVYDINQSIPLRMNDPASPYVFLSNTANLYATPSSRASSLVHEGMHAHYYNGDEQTLDHVDCVLNSGRRDCDRFYPHAKSVYEGDDLKRADTNQRKIPAYQIQLEFDCDVTDHAQDWVPLAVIADAKADSQEASGHFVVSPGVPLTPPFNCGTPSPMMTPPTAGASCDFGACTSDANCGTNQCLDGCCQLVK